ncbi:MAG: chorismate synthase [Bacillota bacterium]
MLRFFTGGESHGPVLTVLVEGMPAGITVSPEYINQYLRRRQQGYGRGGRMKIEADQVAITAGVRGGKTLGSPVVMTIANRDWPNWQTIMDPGVSADLDSRAITRPRPGHADLPAGLKYRHMDLRNILERASARETAARVAAGALAAALLAEVGINVKGHVTQIGAAAVTKQQTLADVLNHVPASAVFCADPEVEKHMIACIDAAKQSGDTLGGVIEVLAWGLPVGLGSHVQWDRRLDGRLAQAVMSIPGIKGVEIGLGFKAATQPGSMVHDEIFFSPERSFYRQTNRAGGIEGGVTNGELLVIRAAMKPIPTLSKPLKSIDIRTKQSAEASYERSDICAVPAASVVAEAMVCLVLAQSLLEKFASDSLAELLESLDNHNRYIRSV